MNQESGGGMPMGGEMPMGEGMPIGGGMPAEPATPPMSMGKGEGLKRQLLQKLITNLLNKPGRSMHEMINGIKDAVSAYKNYAKEWDTLNGISPDQVDPGAEAMSAAASSGGSSDDIRKMLQDIQAQKGATGAGGPGIAIPKMPPLPPTTVRY